MTDINPTDLIVTVNSTETGKSENAVYDFVKPVNDYAVTDITKLWYSWANYYVNLYKDFNTESASATYAPTLPNGPSNEITLTSIPSQSEPLAVGMTVSGNGIRPGTTILSIQDPDGNFIGSANAVGDQIFLSLVPSETTPRTQEFTFDKPLPIPYTITENTYNLTFAQNEKDQEQARLFGGSVYAAMSAEASVLQPPPLPQAAALVGQVITILCEPSDR